MNTRCRKPGEPAEQEADAVADKVTDDLHGPEKKDKHEQTRDTGDHGGHVAGADAEAAHGAASGGTKSDANAPKPGPAAVGASQPSVGRKISRKPTAVLPIAAPQPSLGRKIFRTAHPPTATSTATAGSKSPTTTTGAKTTGKNPNVGQLKSGDERAFVKKACAADKIAMQKIADVEREQDIQDVPPKTAADGFFRTVADIINTEANVDCARAYDTAGFKQAANPYTKKGRKIDRSKITGLCSRSIRVENWWKYNCAQAPYLAQADKVTRGVLKGKEREELAYSLMRLELSQNPGHALATLDRGKAIQPSGVHGWFTDEKVKLEPGLDAGFSQLMHVFALQPEIFADGTIFIEIRPSGLVGEVRKPTAYDGMQSALWVPRPGDEFGVTGGGVREFLADAVPGAAVQSANARVPSSGLEAEIRKYNDMAKTMTGSESATDAAVRGQKPTKEGGKGRKLTESVVDKAQNERQHPTPKAARP